MADTWVIVVLPSMSNAVLSKLRAYVGIYGFRFKKQPEKLLTSCEISCFDFFNVSVFPFGVGKLKYLEEIWSQTGDQVHCLVAETRLQRRGK